MRSLNIKYVPELDQLRGLAALLVFYYHAIAGRAVVEHYMGINQQAVPLADSALKLIIANGFSGVALFFVLSGFIFTWGALPVDQLSWRQFYTNRLLRIYPLFGLLTLSAFALQWGQINFGQLAQSLIGFGNLYPALNDFDRVLWTISIEIQFYLLFPFLIMLLKRQGVIYIVGLIAVMIMLRGIARLENFSLQNPVYWTMFGRLDQFLIGMTTAWWVHRHGWLQEAKVSHPGWRQLGKLALGLIISTAAMIALFWLYTKQGWKYSESYLQVIWPTLDGLMWAAFAIFYVGLVRLYRGRWLQPLQYIGTISFSLYLLHYPIIKALHLKGLVIEITGHRLASGLLTSTLIILPVSLLAATLTYLVIEKPPLAMRKRYTSFAGSDNSRPTVSGSDA